jgi:hypothetical protein
MAPVVPFFLASTLTLKEVDGQLRVTVRGRGLVLVLASWRLIDVENTGGELRLHGAFSDLGDDPNVRIVAGLTPDEAKPAAAAIASRWSLPKRLEIVDSCHVEQNPLAFDGRHVEISAEWTCTLELSSFAGAWLSVPKAVSSREGGRVCARGIWRASRPGELGFGHMGTSKAQLVAYEVLELVTSQSETTSTVNLTSTDQFQVHQKLDVIAAEYALLRIDAYDLPMLALDMINSGVNSLSLAALAGAERSESPADLRELFERGLHEVGVRIPARETAAMLLKHYYARQIVEGALSPRGGAAKILNLLDCVDDIYPSQAAKLDAFGVHEFVHLYYSEEEISEGDIEARKRLDTAILAAAEAVLAAC